MTPADTTVEAVIRARWANVAREFHNVGEQVTSDTTLLRREELAIQSDQLLDTWLRLGTCIPQQRQGD